MKNKMQSAHPLISGNQTGVDYLIIEDKMCKDTNMIQSHLNELWKHGFDVNIKEGDMQTILQVN